METELNCLRRKGSERETPWEIACDARKEEGKRRSHRHRRQDGEIGEEDAS